MATRTIVTCDLCKADIKDGERVLWFSAVRWARNIGGPITEKFEGEFCSDSCVINAVRGLLNG